MDFKQIEAFINVAKHKSFSKAANSVFLSQPAVSSHISTLEKELNVQLFDRTSKEVLLTPAGESFLNFAIDILNTRDKAISNISNFDTNINGKLRLAASTTPCNTILPLLIKGFQKLYSDVSYIVIEQGSSEIVEEIIKFDCEIGIIGNEVKDDKIKCYKLLEDNLVLISSPEFNIPKEISLKSLLNYKFILRENGSATRKTFEDALSTKNVDISELDVCCEVNNQDTLFQFVRNGIGVSIVSDAICNDCLNSGSVRKSLINDITLKRSIYLIISSRRTLTPTAKAFFNLCKNTFKFD